MSLRCLIGIHDFDCLTPEHGFVVNNGLGEFRYNGENYDDKEFLHVGKCRRCGKVEAFVSLLYFTIHGPAWFRDPSAKELETFFAVEAAKTKNTDKHPIPLQHIDVRA